MPRIILIDGNSLAYRAFYALPDTMRASSGLTTNAIYGFTSMLIKALEEKPDFAAISFDLPEPTFRHKEYKEYKATRQKAPPTLYEQIPYIKEAARAFGLPVYELSGYEADDVIGTIAKAAEKKGMEVTIISGDLDPLQLVSDKIKVLTTRKGITDTVLYGEKEVEERYGLKPSQLIDFKALKGDTSDNIPGVPKVGEKTAAELLQEFGTLENVYQNLDKIKKPALQKNLGENLSLAELSKRLGTIVTDAPVEIDWEKCRREAIKWENLIPFFEKMEFDSLVKKYSPKQEGATLFSAIEKKREEIAKLNFKSVKTEAELSDLIDLLNRSKAFAFDLETTGLDTFTAEIVGISFCVESKSAFYLPFRHMDKVSQLPLKETLNKLVPLFNSQKLKIGHNLKYDIKILNNHGIKVGEPYFDTMVAAYLLDPTAGKYSLKHLSRQFLGREMIKLMELIGKDGEYKDFSEVPLDLATDYAASDADSTFSLYEIFKLALSGQKMDKLFYAVEMPVLGVLIEMEENGVSVDTGLLKTMSEELEKELKELERHIFAIAGEIFNLNSPKQMAHILFTKLLLPVLKKTKTGPSTDAEVLEELAGQKFEIAEKILDYRQLSKLKNTYIDVLPTLVHPKTGRIHTSFNQTVTATGRLSSSDPNLQNIPSKGAWGKRLRQAFVPDKKDWVIISADYSQIELRVLAHLSNDPVLIKAFQEDTDIHQSTADQLGISRDAAKTVNFGVIYGISDFGLAKNLNIKRTEAAAYIEKYFATHVGVKEFIARTIKEAKENGYVKTLLGRKRPMPDINSPHGGLRGSAERMAINMPVQGTAADMLKIAMGKIHQKIAAINCGDLEKISAKMLLQVHDELVFECPQEEVETLKKIVASEMIAALPLNIPVRVEVGAGENWMEAKAPYVP